MSRDIHSFIVNALTISRVPLIVLFAVFAIIAQFRGGMILPWVAGFFMFAAGISDMFDGKLARKWKVVSTFGKMADPLMDKVFFIVVFPTLLWLICVQAESVVHGLVMLIFAILWILRDQWVTFLRAVASTYHADVSAMWLGKVRTALSFPCAGFVYAYLALHRPGCLPECLAADLWMPYMLWTVYFIESFLIVLNIYSCYVYTRVYLPYIRKSIEG